MNLNTVSDFVIRRPNVSIAFLENESIINKNGVGLERNIIRETSIYKMRVT